MENRLFIRKVLGSYILHKLEDNVLTILGDSQHTIGGIEPFYKISHKNCDAIVNGYDLDKLSDIRAEILNSYTSGTKWVSDIDKLLTRYREICELLGDKKFSEDDVKYMFQLGFNLDNPISENEYNTHIQSLQKNEWDVEIETIEYGLGNDENGRPVFENRPRLDSDGCITLKVITK